MNESNKWMNYHFIRTININYSTVHLFIAQLIWTRYILFTLITDSSINTRFWKHGKSKVNFQMIRFLLFKKVFFQVSLFISGAKCYGSSGVSYAQLTQVRFETHLYMALYVLAVLYNICMLRTGDVNQRVYRQDLRVSQVSRFNWHICPCSLI